MESKGKGNNDGGEEEDNDRIKKERRNKGKNIDWKRMYR